MSPHYNLKMLKLAIVWGIKLIECCVSRIIIYHLSTIICLAKLNRTTFSRINPFVRLNGRGSLGVHIHKSNVSLTSLLHLPPIIGFVQWFSGSLITVPCSYLLIEVNHVQNYRY